MPLTDPDLGLTSEEYVALRGLALDGVVSDSVKTRNLMQYLTAIEEREGYKMYSILVRWQDPGVPLPAGTNFPEVWPPQLQARVEVYNRPVAKADADRAIRAKQKGVPLNLMATHDLSGLVGWTLFEAFFR